MAAWQLLRLKDGLRLRGIDFTELNLSLKSSTFQAFSGPAEIFIANILCKTIINNLTVYSDRLDCVVFRSTFGYSFKKSVR